MNIFKILHLKYSGKPLKKEVIETPKPPKTADEMMLEELNRDYNGYFTRSEVLNDTNLEDAQLQEMIKIGLFPHAAFARHVGWDNLCTRCKHYNEICWYGKEVSSTLMARYNGKTDDQIRALVSELAVQRQAYEDLKKKVKSQPKPPAIPPAVPPDYRL